MGRDNQAKHRQSARDLRRSKAKLQPYERILIVSEGEKTEPNYINEIRSEFRLSTANVHVLQSAYGTEPIQIVEYAEDLFLKGDRALSLEARAFDSVIVVFDRDSHITYHDALLKVKAINEKYRNNNNEIVKFESVVSVPCFELWLLVHFEDVLAPLHRTQVYHRLKAHIPDYDKGQSGHWDATKSNIDAATVRADQMGVLTDAYNGVEPYTDLQKLVWRLIRLKS